MRLAHMFYWNYLLERHLGSNESVYTCANLRQLEDSCVIFFHDATFRLIIPRVRNEMKHILERFLVLDARPSTC